MEHHLGFKALCTYNMHTILDLHCSEKEVFSDLHVKCHIFFLSGYQVVQVIGLVHTDLHDDQTLNAINFLASSLLWITQDLEQKNSGNNPNYYSD